MDQLFNSLEDQLSFIQHQKSDGKKTTKLCPNQTNQTKQMIQKTLDHLTFVTKGCLRNFSFLGSVEVGYLWLETKQQQKTTTNQF